MAAKVCLRIKKCQVAATAAELGAEKVRKAKWLSVVAGETDPIVTSVLSRFKADEAKADFTGELDADDAAAVTRAIVGHRQFQQVGAPFRWGYCFSCGIDHKDNKGKLKHRLCRQCEKGRNTDIGNLITHGRKVTSVANPMIYPGVVNTLSRHPRLKEGVQSVASERNFRWPRRA